MSYVMNRSASLCTGLVAATSLLGVAAPAAWGQGCEAPVWIPLSPEVSPPDSGRMVYDSSRQVGVATMASGTWEWNGENWSRRATGGPVGVMAFDTARNVTLLLTWEGETWTWDGSLWTRVGVGGPERGDSMAFDSARGVAVLYQGLFRATWEWDGTTWTERARFTDPEDYVAHEYTAMCYDPVAQRVVLYGGMWHAVQTIGAAWAWDGVSWVFENAGPSRAHVGLAFDPLAGERVLFGGFHIVSRLQWISYGDTWVAAAGMPWMLIDELGPSPRAEAMMVYDEARNEMVLFGGRNTYYPGDMDTSTWVRRRTMIADGPGIITQPEDATTPLHGLASFSVGTAGERLTYHWRKNGVAIQDSVRIRGTRTNTLTINNVQVEDQAAYDVVVSNPCGDIVSDAATLWITDRCLADFNANGVVNSQDYFDFVEQFFLGLPGADIDASGTVDSTDFFAFLTGFFAGCPR